MKRINYLDSAKGLFVFLMTISHVGLSAIPAINKLNYESLYLFKMPGFYIISGYLMFNAIEKENFFLRKLDGIYKPYVSIVFLILAIFFLFGHRSNLTMLYSFFLGYEYSIFTISVYPSWFIVNLPFSFLFCQLIVFFIKNKKIECLLLILLVLVFLNVSKTFYPDLKIPFHLNLSIYAVLYLMTGYFFRYCDLNMTSKKLILTCGCVYFIFVFFLAPNIVFLDLFQNEYKNFFATYLASVTGALFFIGLLSLLNGKDLITKILSFLSRHSLFILMLHVPVWNLLEEFFHVKNTIFEIVLLHALMLALCLFVSVTFKKIDKRGLFFSAIKKENAPFYPPKLRD